MPRINPYTLVLVFATLILGSCSNGESISAPAPAGGDTVAPVIGVVTVTNITSTSATVTWTTNEVSSTQVQYGITTTYGSSVSGTANTTNHSVAVVGLAANTLYQYRVASSDSAGNLAISGNATFTTASMATNQYRLSVSITGNGVVTSSMPMGIDCGVDCTHDYSDGTNVTLIAAPGTGFQFSSWGGACSGNTACVVTMSASQTVTAFFNQSNVVDLNCGGPWTGSEENTRITAWPHRDCFRTDPVVGGRTRMTNNAGAEVAWEVGTGWNGQNALRVRPPDGSTGNSGQAGQGYAGLGGHVFHDVRTKRLNIRYLFRYNSNWARYAQRNKWEVAIKYDYSNSSAPVRREGCERGIVEGRVDSLNSRENMAPRQGVCTNMDLAINQDGWYWGPGIRENEWIAVENEFDLETGWYRTYITTQDGVFNQSVHSEINITTGTSGAPAEPVPNPYWWGSVDCTAGCYWDSPADQGVVPRPADTYIWYSHVVMSDSYIGPPTGFVQ